MHLRLLSCYLEKVAESLSKTTVSGIFGRQRNKEDCCWGVCVSQKETNKLFCWTYGPCVRAIQGQIQYFPTEKVRSKHSSFKKLEEKLNWLCE